ncbi:SMC-Scp complex subunit ScpB [Candidatus Woesearchaeota archaeon]|nr:SMC-Scp complex subunit ScpB [Candidatus Woesearchaeota archaeon]
MQEVKNRIETILFTVGRAITFEEIASLCSIGSVGIVRDALNQLAEDYKRRESALMITVDNNVASLNIKKEYLHLTTKLLSESELDKSTQETLALIAYRNPALQSEIIKMRGNGAYDHIKKLKELEFIISEKSGRTRKLKLNSKFYDYFDVVEDKLQQKFNELDKQPDTQEILKVLPKEK